MSHSESTFSADQQTLLALRQLRERVEELEDAAREPIAIVGMACQIPWRRFQSGRLLETAEGKAERDRRNSAVARGFGSNLRTLSCSARQNLQQMGRPLGSP